MNSALSGKYQIVREIARSNDIVYEAMDTELGRRVALKELNLAMGLTGQAKVDRIERFRREARAAGRLNHPNIVTIFQSGEENGRYFIAMEFLEGQNLRDKMSVQGALPLKEALGIAYQMLDALAYAHQHKVIHRDIKPDNVHILPGGVVKLTDFGIARLTEEPALTSNGQVFGTPSYMSPEQIEGKSIDHRSDLFSVGIVLYEMLTGRKPFTGDSVITITYNIMNNAPETMMGVPGAIERVISTALTKSPLQRPASAEQMKADLQRAEQQPATFLPHSPASQNLSHGGMTNYGMPSAYPGGNYAPSAPPQGLMPPNYAPVPPAPAQGQPWPFNHPQQTIPPQQMQPATQYAPQYAPVQLPQAAPGYNPNVPMNFLPPKSEPFTLSPGAKTMLTVLLAAVLIGGGLALGTVAFFHSYSHYRVEAGSQHVAALMQAGETAYNAQDFPAAVQHYEDALAAKPGAKQRAVIEQNLTAAYIHCGQQEGAVQRWETAKTWYDKALKLRENDYTALARSERATAETHLGRSDAAANDRTAAGSSDNIKPLPTTATPYTAADNKPISKEEQERPQREARKLIQEGDDLYKNGQKDEAIKKWEDAIAIAAGTPESQTAHERIKQAQAANSSG